MKLIDGRPLWDFRALIACGGDGGDDGGGGSGMGGSGSGGGMGGEGTGSGAVGPGSGGMGGMGTSTTDVGTSGFGGNPDGGAIGTGMSAPGTAALGFEAFAPPPVAPPPLAPVAFAPPAPPVGALQQIAAASMPALGAAPANAAMTNPALTVQGFGIPGAAPLGNAGFAGIGSPGFGAFGGGLGMMNAMHSANPAQQQAAPQSNVAFGTGPTAGMTGASSAGSSAGFGTSSFGAPSNTSAGGVSTVGPSMGMGFEDMFGGPIGFNDSMAGFEGVYGGTDEATGLEFGGMTPSFALDDALGIGSAGGVPGMTTEQANAALGFSVPTVESQAVPSLVGPSGVTGFGAPLGIGGPGISLGAALGVPTTSVQSTAFGPMGSTVQSGMMANAISQAAEQQAQNAQAAQTAAPASAFGLSGPVGMMGNAVTPMDMATALAMSTALSSAKGSAATQAEEEQMALTPFGGFGNAGLPAFSAPAPAGGFMAGAGMGANAMLSLEAQQAMQQALQEAFGVANVQQTMASMNQPFGSSLQGALGTIGTPTFGMAGGMAPAGFAPVMGVPSAAPAAPTAMAGMFGEGGFNNAGMGMLGAAPAAQTATAPAVPAEAIVPMMESVPAAPLGTPQNPVEIQQALQTNNLQIGAQQAFSPNMLSAVFGLLGGPAGMAAHALATYGTPMTDPWGDNAVGGDDGYGYGPSDVAFDRTPAPAATTPVTPGALSAFRRRYLGAGDDLLRYGMLQRGEREYYDDEPVRMAEGGRVEGRGGALSAIFRAARDMVSPGGDLNPTPAPFEPSMQGVMDAGNFAAEMVNPAPGIDAAIEHARQGDYGNAMIEGTLSMPMIAAGRGIRAFHGSPHDFDRFDLSKIGTGEGAQAYGHGLYMAESPDVARGYRDALTGDGGASLRIGGRDAMDVYSQIENRAARMPARAAQGEYDKLSVLEDLMNEGDLLAVQSRIADGNYSPEAAAWFNKEVAPRFTRDGRLYEVDINADPSRFLDWDAPLSAQSPEVMRALGYRTDEGLARMQAQLDDLQSRGALDTFPTNGGEWDELFNTNYKNPALADDYIRLSREISDNMTRRAPRIDETIEGLVKPRDSWQDGRAAVEASKRLRDSGIPGIKYLDAGSRGAGDGTRNYVVFDDSLITILRKYGVGSLAALPAGVLATIGISRDQAEEMDANRVDAPQQYAEGGRVRSGRGALGAIYDAARSMFSPGGELNPTGPLVEPTAEGVMDVVDFAGEMLTPGPGIEEGMRRMSSARDSYRDGNYLDAAGNAMTGVLEAGMDIPQLGIFAGAGARTANRVALDQAKKLAESGADRRAIWDETGWFKGRDGQWRFEIDDSGARFPGMNGEVALKKRDRIDQSFWHGDLYEAYPDTAAIPLKPEYANPRFSGAHYSGADEQITLNPNILGPGASKPKARSTTLHELQHAVQSREGFATGGSPSDFLDQGSARNTRDALAWKRAVDAKQAEMPGADRIAVENALVQDYQRADLMDMLPNDSARYIANQPWFNEPNFIKKAEQTVRDYGLDRRVDPYKPDEAYRHLAGEVEARNVQTRRDFTPEQRRARPPWETQDVPDDLQIVRMGGDGPQASVDDYLKRINPDGRQVPAADRPNLGMGDMYGMAPRDARPVHTMQTEKFGRVRFVEKDGDVYALARNPDLGEEDVIGYAMNRGNGTELHVVDEAQRLGIGEELSYQFRKRSPYAPSGGLTEGGEATARKVYQRLVDEGVIPRD
jgi:hypothetical protein